MSEVGNQAEGPSTPVTNAAMSSLTSGILGDMRAYHLCLSHPFGKDCGADYTACKPLWFSLEVLPYQGLPYLPWAPQAPETSVSNMHRGNSHGLTLPSFLQPRY